MPGFSKSVTAESRQPVRRVFPLACAPVVAPSVRGKVACTWARASGNGGTLGPWASSHPAAMGGQQPCCFPPLHTARGGRWLTPLGESACRHRWATLRMWPGHRMPACTQGVSTVAGQHRRAKSPPGNTTGPNRRVKSPPGQIAARPNRRRATPRRAKPPGASPLYQAQLSVVGLPALNGQGLPPQYLRVDCPPALVADPNCHAACNASAALSPSSWTGVSAYARARITALLQGEPLMQGSRGQRWWWRPQACQPPPAAHACLTANAC